MCLPVVGQQVPGEHGGEHRRETHEHHPLITHHTTPHHTRDREKESGRVSSAEKEEVASGRKMQYLIEAAVLHSFTFKQNTRTTK